MNFGHQQCDYYDIHGDVSIQTETQFVSGPDVLDNYFEMHE